MTAGLWSRVAALLAAGGVCVAPIAAAAQEAKAGAVAYLPDSVSPFGAPGVTNDEGKSVEMPNLAFTEIPADAADFDKYYYFHRADTDYATAFADISECDGYARGLASNISYQQAPYPYTYTMAGAVGGAIGNALAVAIFGSAEKRRLRRINMRRCMNYKGYGRYGLSKERWTAFNFEEGFSGVGADARLGKLKQQALVAATAAPAGKELGL